jgi:hypothetical protein
MPAGIAKKAPECDFRKSRVITGIFPTLIIFLSLPISRVVMGTIPVNTRKHP